MHRPLRTCPSVLPITPPRPGFYSLVPKIVSVIVTICSKRPLHRDVCILPKVFFGGDQEAVYSPPKPGPVPSTEHKYLRLPLSPTSKYELRPCGENGQVKKSQRVLAVASGFSFARPSPLAPSNRQFLTHCLLLDVTFLLPFLHREHRAQSGPSGMWF